MQLRSCLGTDVCRVTIRPQTHPPPNTTHTALSIDCTCSPPLHLRRPQFGAQQVNFLWRLRGGERNCGFSRVSPNGVKRCRSTGRRIVPLGRRRQRMEQVKGMAAKGMAARAMAARGMATAAIHMGGNKVCRQPTIRMGDNRVFPQPVIPTAGSRAWRRPPAIPTAGSRARRSMAGSRAPLTAATGNHHHRKAMALRRTPHPRAPTAHNPRTRPCSRPTRTGPSSRFSSKRIPTGAGRSTRPSSAGSCPRAALRSPLARCASCCTSSRTTPPIPPESAPRAS